jgi:hypothetical protein
MQEPVLQGEIIWDKLFKGIYFKKLLTYSTPAFNSNAGNRLNHPSS